MAIRFQCVQCKKWLGIGSRKAGTTIECPICHVSQTVPERTVYPPAAGDPEESFEAPVLLPEVAGEERFERSDWSLPTPVTTLAPQVPAHVEGPEQTLPAEPACRKAPLITRVFRAVWVLGLLGLVSAAIVVTMVHFYSLDQKPPEPSENLQASLFSSPEPLPFPKALTESPTVTPADSAPDTKANALKDANVESKTPLAKPVEKSGKTAASEPAQPEPIPVEPKINQLPVKEPPTKESKPVQSEPRAEPPVAVTKKFKRRADMSAEELRKQLLLIPEVRLDAVPGSSQKLLVAAKVAPNPGLDLAPLLMRNRPDLAGLPIKIGVDCRLGKEAAENLQALSRKLRQNLEKSIPGNRFGSAAGTLADPRPDPVLLRTLLLGASRSEWLRAEAIPTLLQLLMAENQDVRHVLVELLAEIPGVQASRALAKRALFDLHPEVRQAAVEALKNRPQEDYLETLFEGFQYPWFPVADHAAEALVHLGCRDVIPNLVRLLDAKDTNRPQVIEHNKQKVYIVQELVRINHLLNCFMCHAASLARSDLVRGRVPIPGQPLPAPVTTPQYYEGNQGIFVRADITYLFQDFSVHQPTTNVKEWPAHQRYDYLVRRRPLTPAEVAAWRSKSPGKDSKRKEALLFAIRELGREEAALTLDNWRTVFDPITGEKLGKRQESALEQARRIASALVDARGAKREQLLMLIKEREGDVYDLALLLALRDLPTDLQRKTRAVLAERFAELPLATLRVKLQDPDREVRLAAVSACAHREIKTLAEELEPLSRDADAEIAEEAERVRCIIDPSYVPEKQIARLARKLVDASAKQQKDLFEQYRKVENSVYFQALARAIPDLPVKLQTEVRQHLAQRMADGPLDALIERMADKSAEIRLAAVKAARLKGARSTIPHLIRRLNDQEYPVIAQARESLEYFTGLNMGPYKDANPTQRAEIMRKWNEWWKKNKDR